MWRDTGVCEHKQEIKKDKTNKRKFKSIEKTEMQSLPNSYY